MADYRIYTGQGREYKFTNLVDARKKAHSIAKHGFYVEICDYLARDYHYPDGYVIGMAYPDGKRVIWEDREARYSLYRSGALGMRIATFRR